MLAIRIVTAGRFAPDRAARATGQEGRCTGGGSLLGRYDGGGRFRVYAGTRVEALALVPWDTAAKDAFLGMQFAAQRRSYAAQFPKAERALVLCDGAPVGQCSVDRPGEAVLLVDVALLPERRNTGIGTARLGFATVARSGLHLAMVWHPGPLDRAGQEADGAGPGR